VDVHLRLRRSDYAMLRRAAEADGVKLTAFIRSASLELAENINQESDAFSREDASLFGAGSAPP
jgi:uncharacterized protein (DUF1778 family)